MPPTRRLDQMQLWGSRPVGCSGLVVLAAVDDQHDDGGTELEHVSRTWLVDEATADLAVEMLGDAVASGREVDLDHLVWQAARANGITPG